MGWGPFGAPGWGYFLPSCPITSFNSHKWQDGHCWRAQQRSLTPTYLLFSFYLLYNRPPAPNHLPLTVTKETNVISAGRFSARAVSARAAGCRASQSGGMKRARAGTLGPVYLLTVFMETGSDWPTEFSSGRRRTHHIWASSIWARGSPCCAPSQLSAGSRSPSK